MRCTEARAMRHLYLDAEISVADTPALEAHLRGCRACAAIFRRERELSAAIEVDMPRYAVPDLLRTRIRDRLHREGGWRLGELRFLRRGWNPAAIAASIVLAMAASSATTAIMAGAEEDRTEQEVLASHIRSLMAGHLTDVKSTDQHTVKPWFNGKLDISPPVVDLSSDGFPLVGGRLDYIDHRPVAALVYRRLHHVINVLVSAEGKNTAAAASAQTRRGYNVTRFDRGGMRFWVISDLNSNELRDFAAKLSEAARDQSGRS
jgi:anti-sigma factor RsiW